MIISDPLGERKSFQPPIHGKSRLAAGAWSCDTRTAWRDRGHGVKEVPSKQDRASLQLLGVGNTVCHQVNPEPGHRQGREVRLPTASTVWVPMSSHVPVKG